MDANNRKYFSRSWAMLTKEKGWIKPILVLAIAVVVPIAGALGVSGYAFEWARLSAWGVESSPKQSKVGVGACIAAGWRVFVVGLVWWVAWFIASNIVLWLFGAILGSGFAGFVNFLLLVASFFFALVVTAAGLRATIYTKITAGLNPVRVFEMVRRDASGLAKIVLIPLATGAIAFVLAIIFYLAVIVAMIGAVASAYGTSMYSDAGSAAALNQIMAALGGLIPAFVLFGYVMSVLTVSAQLLEINSVGLWMSQFNVPAWGGPNDPLPETISLPEPTSPVAPGSETPEPAPVSPAVAAPVVSTEGTVEPPVTAGPAAVEPAATEPDAAEAEVNAEPSEAPASESPATPAETAGVEAPAAEPVIPVSVPDEDSAPAPVPVMTPDVGLQETPAAAEETAESQPADSPAARPAPDDAEKTGEE